MPTKKKSPSKKVEVEAEVPAKKTAGKGRPAGSTNKPKPPERHSEMGKVEQIPLAEINLDNEYFRFRTRITVGDLVKSIGEEGLQIPIILRPFSEEELERSGAESEFKYQVVSGFRRTTAIKKLGWRDVDAIIRTDLTNDGDALKVSVIENESRKTYNDLDRANAILAFHKLGKTYAEIESIFNIGERQRQRLQELTRLPEELQDALAEDKVSSSHAVRLMQHTRKVPDVDLKSWIKKIDEEKLSFNALHRLLSAEESKEKEKKPVELFLKEGAGKKRSFRVRPIAISAETPEKQLALIQKQLKELSKFVDGLLSK